MSDAQSSTYIMEYSEMKGCKYEHITKPGWRYFNSIYVILVLLRHHAVQFGVFFTNVQTRSRAR
jgi:hypothetical protein